MGHSLSTEDPLQSTEDRGKQCVAQSSLIRETMTLLDCKSPGHREVSYSLCIPTLPRTFLELPGEHCVTQFRDQSFSEVVQPAQSFHSGPQACCTVFVLSNTGP